MQQQQSAKAHETVER
jgi:hypothetical protein